MKIELTWLPGFSASCLHAADAVRRGMPLADARLAEAVAESAAGLDHDIAAAGLPADRMWRNIVALAASIENNRQLAEVALDKTYRPLAANESLVSRLASWIAELEAKVRLAFPKLMEELALRGGPLHQQWEARGPGLLRSAARLTDETILAPRATVVLVYPALGGGGAAHMLYNAVRIEAVLANPLAALPEVVRLGWLLAQLNLELPVFSEAIHADRLPRVAALAMLPVALKAAEDVELARCDRETMSAALTAWRLDANSQANIVDTLVEWWETYLASRPPWSVALSALDRMLEKQ